MDLLSYLQCVVYVSKCVKFLRIKVNLSDKRKFVLPPYFYSSLSRT